MIGRLDQMRRIGGYGLGALCASLFYLVSFVIELPSPRAGLAFEVGFALFFYLVNGFFLTLVLLIAPWVLAVRLYPKWRWAGWAYFISVGAFLTFAIGCATASLSPKPLFIEDQTFFEGMRIAAERQGLCFGMAGAIHGFAYWLIGEKGY